MLLGRYIRPSSSKSISGTVTALHSRKIHLTHLKTLPDNSLETFKQHAFIPSLPMLLPRGTFLNSMPAITTWFTNNPPSPPPDSNTPPPPVQLNIPHLTPYGDTTVPLEITTTTTSSHGAATSTFERTEAPLSLFLSHIHTLQSSSPPPTSTTNPTTHHTIYLAQSPLSLLPPTLIATTLPTPLYVTHSGKGDIYTSSLWLGHAPTHTPLHRDPNPNLFVQLAGRKVVRVFEPNVGRELVVKAGGDARGLGEDMMVGEGRRALDRVVWGELDVKEEINEESGSGIVGWEAVLDAGDGMFIPKGWWHSIKGVGVGMIGSVNWWFR